jgi:DnaJ-class molecular chaperone
MSMTTVNTTITYDSVKPNKDSKTALLSIELTKLFNWHVLSAENIELKRNMTLNEAFYGKVVNIEYERVVENKACEVFTCALCKGTKFVLKGKSIDQGSSLEQKIIAPCPDCTGLGIETRNNCSPLMLIQETIDISFPPGCRPGHFVTTKLSGNTYYRNNMFNIGDLKLIIEFIEKDNFIVEKDHVSLTLTLTPDQALNGFITEVPYMDQILRVERINKVTLPSSSIRLHGLGFPIVSDGVNPIGSSSVLRDDLVIQFELELEGEDNDEVISPLSGETLLLDGQSVVDEMLLKMDNKRKDRVLRNMLLFLAKQAK